MKLDILAIASHPDDIELGCSGVLMMKNYMERKWV
jgi:LmbE family N-acetylglucosaminyl deacetylase